MLANAQVKQAAADNPLICEHGLSAALLEPLVGQLFVPRLP